MMGTPALMIYAIIRGLVPHVLILPTPTHVMTLHGVTGQIVAVVVHATCTPEGYAMIPTRAPRTVAMKELIHAFSLLREFVAPARTAMTIIPAPLIVATTLDRDQPAQISITPIHAMTRNIARKMMFVREECAPRVQPRPAMIITIALLIPATRLRINASMLRPAPMVTAMAIMINRRAAMIATTATPRSILAPLRFAGMALMMIAQAWMRLVLCLMMEMMEGVMGAGAWCRQERPGVIRHWPGDYIWRPCWQPSGSGED